MADDMNDWNQQIIAEFRANDGKVGGPFEGAPMVLITHRGAKTGIERTTPLMAQVRGDDLVIFASKAGAPDNPDWYHNLRANPLVTIELGAERFEARARIAEGEERQRLYDAQAALMPAFADYQRKSPRQIPVVVLERVS
jgi:deazaflavin-dependent oxidoreductase (nitroreductase family)